MFSSSSGLQYGYIPSLKAKMSSVCVSASFSQVSSPSLGVYRMQIGQLTLEVSSGDITKEASDVIINSSNQDFTLKSGDYASWQRSNSFLCLSRSENHNESSLLNKACRMFNFICTSPITCLTVIFFRIFPSFQAAINFSPFQWKLMCRDLKLSAEIIHHSPHHVGFHVTFHCVVTHWGLLKSWSL